MYYLLGTIKEIDEVIKANFIPYLCKALETETFDIKKEVSVYFFINILLLLSLLLIINY